MTEPAPAFLALDGWAGRHLVPIRVVGETPKRYRVELLEDANLPSRRFAKAGDTVLVPKYAVLTPKEATP